MLNLLAVMLSAAPIDPLLAYGDVTVTGWSADETKFSVRAFDRAEAGDGMEELPDCKGYVDQNGKKFQGRLVLAAYEKGKLLQSWVVQDYPACTPADKAKETLTAAKAKFAELGIDLTAKGSQLKCEKPCDLKHGGAQLVWENATKSTYDDEGMEGRFKGTMRVWLKTAKEKLSLFEQKVDEKFTPMMGGKMGAGLRAVEVSPGGKAMLVRAFTYFSSGRGGRQTQRPVGFYLWNGDVLEKQ